MSPAYRYKKLENRFFSRVIDFGRWFIGNIRGGIEKLFRMGRHKFTVMLIPHSERRIFNFQVNLFTILFIFLLIGGMGIGFFTLTTRYTSTEQVLERQTKNLQSAQANLELVREEVAELQRVARKFQGNLTTTLETLGITLTKPSTPDIQQGDLSSFLNMNASSTEQLQELNEIKSIRTVLESSLDPLKELKNVLSSQKDLLLDIPTLWPVKGVRGRITNRFGPEIHPFTGQWYLHKGIDIAFGYNIPIVATARGKVVSIDYEPLGFGNYIIIRHKYGFYTRYAHLQRILVNRGQEVSQGQVIGTMGNTGLSTGPHLHYEVRIGAEVVDPAKYLNISAGNQEPIE
ncbi:MAG TPA: peptidoglycan DD-metalloendopeptidase family protein [Spirochaetales bacterium]|nr:peptidoglycan DD-metalloendopeptidase family protein [Spirochaetales bacterium]